MSTGIEEKLPGAQAGAAENPRTSSHPEVIAQAIRDSLTFDLAQFPAVATGNDYYLSLAHVVRDRLLHRWVSTAQTYLEEERRTVCYLSAEFLMGPQLGNNLLNLDLEQEARPSSFPATHSTRRAEGNAVRYLQILCGAWEVSAIVTLSRNRAIKLCWKPRTFCAQRRVQ